MECGNSKSSHVLIFREYPGNGDIGVSLSNMLERNVVGGNSYSLKIGKGLCDFFECKKVGR